MAYFQATVYSELDMLNGMASVNDIFMWGTDSGHLLHTLDAVLGQLECGHLYATAHKRMLYGTSTKWIGKVYPSDVVKYHHERETLDAVDAGVTINDMGYDPIGCLRAMLRTSQFW